MFRKIKKTKELSSIHVIVLFYLSAAILSTILLSFDFFHEKGVELTWLDTIFTAVSAISVTGLTVVNTADTFNVPGQIALVFVLQFGGIGIMTLGTFVYAVLGKKIGLRTRQLIRIDQNRNTFAGMVQLMFQILKTILFIELIGMVILSIHFLNYFDSWQEALMQGFFASVSATTNAGFDITGSSLVPFANDYFVQFINMLLLTLGAIGFPVLLEVQDLLWGRYKNAHWQFQFSLFAKLTTFTFFSLFIFGTIGIILFEWQGFFADKSWHETLFYSMFQSLTTRNGGLATMDVADFSMPTLLLLCGLMFIGASPSSVGGGIRTTTFAIILLTIYHYAKGHNTIKVFRREIDSEDVIRSFIVASTAIFLCSTAIILLIWMEPLDNMALAFEVFSAFGTTGLSMGITADLSPFGKGIIILLMFIGRIGIFSFIFLIRGKDAHDRYHYPKEKMIIG
ncbi:Trk-type K+ transport system, membrane component [Gracilibacillus halophilus YIM-C55.5]|uniref:Trk-type K+ transport system, membrane component n=1 Tax=Gracilibacillus halophilus YIM-C55.5 TaxID=1308866 RepID=N4WBW1_9BACI|nr:TrkH family potassium uptake protein [Gracilibacillus halophilus]ENH96749.1 Trk-type K+ transport system, membrane component [Gracilibacillus halophilus YIM-C55.5]